ncbi:probable nucleoside diphosphate kinase 5 [Tanacetum coccineum]
MLRGFTDPVVIVVLLSVASFSISSLATADLEIERTLSIVKPDGVSGNGPVFLMVLGKTNAIADWRALFGPTDALKAKVTHPDSIRAMCGQDLE